MQIGTKSRSVAIMVLLSLSGCAAPIKALMGEPTKPQVDEAALQTSDPQEALLRAALMKKGQELLKARTAAPGGPAPVAQDTLPKRSFPQGPSQAVAAMLARAKSAAPPQPVAAGTPDLKNAFRVKDETRFRNSPTGSVQNRPDSVLIRFTPGMASLDAEGTKALTEIARRSETSPTIKIVLVAGLSGRGTPWERMQAASERLEMVARHVPAPLRIERKFEIELDGQQMRLELHRGAR